MPQPITTSDPHAAANIALALCALGINPALDGFDRSASRTHRDSLEGDLRLCSPIHATYRIEGNCVWTTITLDAPESVNHGARWVAWMEGTGPAYFYWEG
jgi:hypothetical protein